MRLAVRGAQRQDAPGDARRREAGGSLRPVQESDRDVTIELPVGSQLAVELGLGGLRSTGSLGACRVKSGMGDIELDRTGSVDVSSGAGAVEVGHVAGDAEIRTASGRVRLGHVAGAAAVKSANGDIRVGEVAGDLVVSTANGDVRVDRAGGDVALSSANGALRVDEVARRAASLKTARGGIEIGLRAGSAARLDVSTHFGRVRNDLDGVAAPEPTDATVEVRARTAYGDIVIRRAEARNFLDKAV